MGVEQKRRDRNAYMREYYRRKKKALGASPVTVWRHTHPEATQRHRDEEKRRRLNNPEVRIRHAQRSRENNRRSKIEAFEAYGGMTCQCCGETEEAFLTLDHVENDGAFWRRTLGHSGRGSQFHRWLKNAGYPPGIQVLCMNCNFAKRLGECPHQKRKRRT